MADYAPIFAICSVDAGVAAVLGGTGASCRLYPFGEAPQQTTKPYAVWQTVTGTPENYLDKIPDVDSWGIQIDAYASTVTTCRNIAEALRNAIEPYAHIVSWGGDDRDPDTNLYRVNFSVDWWVERT